MGAETVVIPAGTGMDTGALEPDLCELCQRTVEQ